MARRKKYPRKMHVRPCGCYYDTSDSKWILCKEGKMLLRGWKSWEDMERYWEHLNGDEKNKSK